MRRSPREKGLKRRALKKGLGVQKSRVDGTFTVFLRIDIPLFPRDMQIVPWGKRKRIYPPEVQFYGAASLKEVEQFVRQYAPPWSRQIDPKVTASIAKTMFAVADAVRESQEKSGPSDVLDLSRLTPEEVELFFGPGRQDSKIH